MKKIFLGLSFLLISFVSFGQLNKTLLRRIIDRDIKGTGAYSSFKMGKLLDSIVYSTPSQILTSGHFYVGNASDTAASVAASGDLNLSSAGAFSVIKILGNTIPANASGSLTNNGAGILTWTAATGGTVTSIATSSPITGGTITGTGTIGINDAAADGSTKGAATFTAADFNASSGNISIDYTNGQVATGSVKGFLTAADWTTFNNKGSGTVTSVSGTSNRITSTGGATPVIDISASYVGQSSITTLGTIGTGVWQGTTIGVGFGGTGTATTFTQGSSIFAGASGVYSQDNANYFWDATNHRLGIGNAVPAVSLHVAETSTSSPRGILNDQYSTGTNGGMISIRKARGTFGTPTTIVTADVLGSLTFDGHDGTAFVNSARILATSTGTISTGVVQSIMALQTANALGTITTAITINGSQVVSLTNALAATSGGTGFASFTVGDILSASTTTALSKIAAVATGSVLGSAGTGTLPAYLAVSNGLTATSSTFKLGGSITGATNISTTAASQLTIDGSFTASANKQYSTAFNGTFTARATASDTLTAYRFAPTLNSAANSQVLSVVDIEPTYGGSGTSIQQMGLRVLGTGRAQFGANPPDIASPTGTVIISAQSAPAYPLDIVATGATKLFRFRIANTAVPQLIFGSATATTVAGMIQPQNSDTPAAAGQGLIFSHTVGSATNRTGVLIAPNAASVTDNTSSGTNVLLKINGVTVQTSGTTGWTSILVNPTINQTSTASGAWIGLDYNPTLTAVLGTHYGIVVRPTGALNGFGTGSPTSTVTVSGSFAAAYVAKTGTYSATSLDYFIDCTSNSFTVTLPTAVGITGRQYIIKNSGTATVITIATTSSQTVDGAAPTTLTTAVPLRVVSDGANWKTF